MIFVDLAKVFVKDPGDFGCPAKFISVLWCFHDGMMARMVENGRILDSFLVISGTKQGGVLPSPFSLL